MLLENMDAISPLGFLSFFQAYRKECLRSYEKGGRGINWDGGEKLNWENVRKIERENNGTYVYIVKCGRMYI